MIADLFSNKQLNPTVIELLTESRKINISLLLTTQTYFAIPRKIQLNSIHNINVKIPNKRVIQEIAFHHSSDFDFQYFMNFYKESTAKPYSF